MKEIKTIFNDSNELSRLEHSILKLKDECSVVKTKNVINNDLHNSLYERGIRLLNEVAKLSIPVSELEERLKIKYDLEYIEFPQIGRKLLYEHYAELHHPYNILKNRCYNILDLIDNIYQSKFEKNPPNWDGHFLKVLHA